MKKLLFVLSLVLCFTTAQAEGPWDYFFKPRPPLNLNRPQLFTLTGSQSVWMFKPSVAVSLTEIRAGANGGATQTNFLNAVGMMLTFQKTTYDEAGLNYADYSLNAGLLASGTTNDAPVFTPRAAILFGALNNLVMFGPSYDLMGHSDKSSRWALLISLGINLTNN